MTKEVIIEGYANDGVLIDKMDEVLKKIYQDHDIIIVSDGMRPAIQAFMQKHNLIQYIEDIFGKPYVIQSNGMSAVCLLFVLFHL